MGDWSDNLEYEQREYYGHLYDTDEDVHEEETEEETDDLISKQKVFNTLDNADKFLDEERTVEKYKELLTECIKVLPSDSEYSNKCFDGMTNGEVIKALFPNIKQIEKVYTTRKYALMDKSVKALLFLKTTDRWWNAPYKAERGET